MKTYMFEAQHGPGLGNWGKFMVGVLDEGELAYQSQVDPPARSLLDACGWDTRHRVWVFDLQTGEGCYVKLGGYAHADLEKHRVWVCPLFEPWLAWLYEQVLEHGGDLGCIPGLPRLVDLPDAAFAFAGYRRPGQ